MRLTRQSIKEKHPTYTDEQVDKYIRDWENEQPQTAQFSWTTVKHQPPGTKSPVYDDASASELSYWQKNDPNFTSEIQEFLKRRTMGQSKISNLHGADPLYQAQMDYLRGHKRPIPQTASEPRQVFDQPQTMIGAMSGARSATTPVQVIKDERSETPMEWGDYLTAYNTYAPEYKRAETEPLPLYKARQYQKAEVDRLAQERAGAFIRNQEEMTGRAVNRKFENAQVQRMTLRDALASHGLAMSNILSSAGKEAAGEYGDRYRMETANDLNEYQSKVAAVKDKNEDIREENRMNYTGRSAAFNTAWNTYIKSLYG